MAKLIAFSRGDSCGFHCGTHASGAKPMLERNRAGICFICTGKFREPRPWGQSDGTNS